MPDFAFKSNDMNAFLPDQEPSTNIEDRRGANTRQHIIQSADRSAIEDQVGLVEAREALRKYTQKDTRLGTWMNE